MEILPKFLNRKISTPAGIIIIVLTALLVGAILFWQYLLISGHIVLPIEFRIIKEKPEWPLSIDKYVFIEQHTHTEGEVIEGEKSMKCGGPREMIDEPTYSFNSETEILNGMIGFKVDETLKLVYGSGRSLSGFAGGGVSTNLTGIYNIPYTGINVIIHKIENNGTVHLTYKGNKIILETNEKWEDTFTKIEEFDFCKIKYTITDKIINYGILDKDKIQSW